VWTVSVITTWHPSFGTTPPKDLSASGFDLRSRPRMSVSGWALTIAGVLAVLAGGWWVTNSPMFDMRSLEISGTTHLTERRVARLAGMDSDTNVLWLSEDAVEIRLETDPWVASAEVTRSLPSSISIRVRERVPAATIAAGAHRFLVSSDGMVLGPAPAKTRLPLVGGSFGEIAPGAQLTDVTPALRAVAALPPELRQSVLQGSVNDDGLLTLRLRRGTTAIYGDASDAEEKGIALLAVMVWAAENGANPIFVNVESPAMPAVRLPRGTGDGAASGEPE
jgi:cell division protein FtsQ